MVNISRTPVAPLARISSIRVIESILNVLAILGVVSLLIAAAVWVAGARIIIFSSGSMAPAIPAGAIALTVPCETNELRTGDVITVQRPGDDHFVTHRVVALDLSDGATYATLRGDANPVNDAMPYLLGPTTQRVTWAAPEIGKAVARAQSPWMLLAVAALLIVLAIPTRPATTGTSSAGLWRHPRTARHPAASFRGSMLNPSASDAPQRRRSDEPSEQNVRGRSEDEEAR